MASRGPPAPTGRGLRHRDGVEAPGVALQQPVERPQDGGRGVGSTPVKAVESHLAGGDLGHLERELGVDPEVAAGSTPAGPEQIRVVLGVHVKHAPSGGDDPGGQQVIAGQAAPVRVVADAPAEREPTDADRQAGPSGEHEVSVDRLVEHVLVTGGAGHHRTPAAVVDADVVELADVDQQPLGRGIAGVAVTSSPGHRLHAVRARPVHTRDHVGLAAAPGHRQRPDRVITEVRRGAGGVVAGVTGEQQPPMQRSAELCQRAPRHSRVGRAGVPGGRPRVGRERQPQAQRSGGSRADQVSAGQLGHRTTSTDPIIPRSSWAMT